MNKRILKKRNSDGRALYLFDHFCSIPKVALAKYFELYPRDWSKVKNVHKNNFAIKTFKSELLTQQKNEAEKYNSRILEIRNGNFLRYWKLKQREKKISDAFEDRHKAMHLHIEIQMYDYTS